MTHYLTLFTDSFEESFICYSFERVEVILEQWEKEHPDGLVTYKRVYEGLQEALNGLV